MAVRVMCYFEFLSCWCARRNLGCRPLTRLTTIVQQRTLCLKVPRPYTWCSKYALRASSSGFRSFSVGGNRGDKETDVSETQPNTLDTTDLADLKHDDSSDQEIGDTPEHSYHDADAGRHEENSPPNHQLDQTSADIDTPEHSYREADAGGHEENSPPNHQLNQTSADNDTTERNKGGTLNLSNLTWSDDGIVIYPEIHFGTQKKKEKSGLTSWKDEAAGTKDSHIQSLLYNIQKSRSKKEQVVVRERRSTVMSAEEMVEFLQEQNARDIVVIELPPEVDYVRYFMVCSGMGTRHIGRMADNVVAEMRGVRLGKERRKIRVEGRDCDDWMAVDLGGMVIHFMLEEIRRKYELEKLWALGEDYDDQYREMKADLLEEKDATNMSHTADRDGGTMTEHGRMETALALNDQDMMMYDVSTRDGRRMEHGGSDGCTIETVDDGQDHVSREGNKYSHHGQYEDKNI